ncbi:DUF5320 domain-containing protein [Thermohalobacter berrensis]|uniref:DUF5320 domain-containing protein n=1 Tax=Thermohalobacter berrensis TaxID=99594 RepID=A0A419T159_9FIRM|nr:DUF5320 domain-containing protein [Thermohalobacter berrensis]RKD31186.1 hypothetical protein BET03_03400 [Thermohalobacter berrensis]
MPRGDRTGPYGEGPMTGRGMGYCRGLAAPGYTRSNRRGFGRGFGRGYIGKGFRRGFGRRFAPYNDYNNVPSNEDIKGFLEEEKKILKSEIEEIEKRLKEIEDKDND